MTYAVRPDRLDLPASAQVAASALSAATSYCRTGLLEPGDTFTVRDGAGCLEERPLKVG